MSWKRITLCLVAALVATLPAAADWSAGVTAFKAGDLGTAESEFRALTESQPDWPGGHLMLGQTLLRDGRASEALASLERAHELAPDDFQAAFALGQAQIKLERFGDAAAVLTGLDPAPLPAPQRLAFHQLRAAALAGAGEHARALPDLEAAVALEPDDADLRRRLAQRAKAAGRADLAITHYGRAAELDPGDGDSAAALVELLYNRAITADGSRQSSLCGEVVPHARRLVELDDSFENLVLLSKVATCVGLNEVARDTLAAAVAARPDDWSARFALAKVHARLGAWTEARAAYEDTLMKSVPAEEKAEVQRRLGLAYEHLEELDEALAQYRRAGDTEAVARVEQNIRAREEAIKLDALAAEQARIERELAELEKGSGI